MKKYNINENRPELTKEQMEKGKDFSKIESKASANAGSSFSKGMIAGLVSIVLILSAVLFFSKDDKKQIVENENAVLNSDANQPTVFMVDVAKDTTLLYNTGSLIKIPANSFVDSSGNKVEGLVELKYREFHNVGEIILSGIPMTYDSAGTQYHFESAGMFEMHAFQNGNPVFIANEKSIEINLASLDKDKTKFNQYYFNQKTDKWDYTGEDIPTIVNAGEGAETKKVLVTIDLIKPVAKQKTQQQFTISINYEEFPELIAFDNVLFEVSPETKNFDPATASIKWDNVEIERVEKTNNYKLTFTNDSKSYEVIAYPVVDKKDLKKAQAKWDYLYNNYKMKSAAKDQRSKENEQSLNRQISFNEKAVKYFKTLVQSRDNQKIAKDVGVTEEIVYRSFQVQGFGIWNSDCPSSMPDSAMVSAKYLTEDGKPVDIAIVYMVESSKNTLYTLYKGEKVYFDPGEDNTLIVITKDNSIGRFTKEQFKYLDKDTKEFTFKLKMDKKSNYLPTDITEIL